MSMIAKNRIHSAWTPLSNNETNNKMFEERISLVGKWFGKWNDDQRRKLFEELVGKSKRRQLEYARELIDTRIPCTNDDFTRVLPRVITLYIFSFLDARSLCSCAQVCWYWRYLTELDQLWMPKCLHFGWYLSFTPSPYENGVWKRNFIEQFRIVKVLFPKSSPVTELSKLKLEHKGHDKLNDDKKSGPKPWRGSDPVPKDTWRYNILHNDEVIDHIAKCRQKKVYGSSADEIMRKARSKVNTGSHSLNTLMKSQSLTRVNGTDSSSERPRWAKTNSSSQLIHKDAMKSNGVLAKITRPGPVSPPPKLERDHSSKPIATRSARDPPSTNLFPESPWKLPTKIESDDED